MQHSKAYTLKRRRELAGSVHLRWTSNKGVFLPPSNELQVIWTQMHLSGYNLAPHTILLLLMATWTHLEAPEDDLEEGSATATLFEHLMTVPWVMAS